MCAVLFKSFGGVGATADEASPGPRAAGGAGQAAFTAVPSLASWKIFFTSLQNFLVSKSCIGFDFRFPDGMVSATVVAVASE